MNTTTAQAVREYHVIVRTPRGFGGDYVTAASGSQAARMVARSFAVDGGWAAFQVYPVEVTRVAA